MRWFAYALWGLVVLLIPLTAHAENASQLRFYNEELKKFIEAPGIAAEIHTDINGTVARTGVVQYFFNDTDDWQEGVYTYPLPDDAAVDKLVMVVGERRILGFVAEKEEARRIYEDAKKEGKATGLVEQHRPNIFRTSVANIPPRALVAIEISYQHEMRIDADTVSLRLPLAITPRYDRFDIQDFITLASAAPQDTKMHALGERLALFDFEDGHNPVQLRVSLAPGFKPLKIDSPSHSLDIGQVDDLYLVNLRDRILAGEQDFVLAWQFPGDALTGFLHTEEIDNAHYAHFMVLPPQTLESEQAPPRRQLTLIIDTSGSMSGPSILQAKAALREALYDLEAYDFFNVIRFESMTESLFDGPMPANEEHVKKALRWVDQLEASGGTEMQPAVALALSEPELEGLLRQVVFITDGAIGYENELGAFIRDHVGNARFYAVGIGAAPNTHLMRTFAQMGRGSFTFIGDVTETEKKMKALFHKMKAPVMTDLSLDIPTDISAEMVPAKLPDLMLGEPVSVALKSDKPIRSLTLQGRRAGKSWSQTIKAAANAPASGAGKIYARRKISDLKFADPRGEKPETKGMITDLGIRHQIVSAHTSLVAVDEIKLRPKNAILLSKRYNPNLPKGWQLAEYDPREMAGAYKKMKEEERQERDSLKKNINLPQTADGYFLRMAGGLVLIGLALLLGWKERRYETA